MATGDFKQKGNPDLLQFGKMEGYVPEHLKAHFDGGKFPDYYSNSGFLPEKNNPEDGKIEMGIDFSAKKKKGPSEEDLCKMILEIIGEPISPLVNDANNLDFLEIDEDE